MRVRLDVLLTRRGLCPSRERAKAEILAGHVLVNGAPADKPGLLCEEQADLHLHGAVLQYVGRGGLKLEKALEVFSIHPEGRVCLDCGASTGGFTDCLLQRSAALVYAVDVGSGQLAAELREHPRVRNMEQTDIRLLQPEALEATPSLAVVDVSFISLRLVLPSVRRLLEAEGEAVCLIKPQFEAGKSAVGKRGVVRDESVHRLVLEELLAAVPDFGLFPRGLSWSPVRGGEGNLEFLCHLTCGGESAKLDIAGIVRAAHKELG